MPTTKAQPINPQVKRTWRCLGEEGNNIGYFEDFLQKVLQPSLNQIKLIDIHQLLQQPIIKQGKKTNRPIIIKLCTTFDKKLTNLDRLADKSAFSTHLNARPVFITEQLPKLFLTKKWRFMTISNKQENRRKRHLGE